MTSAGVYTGDGILIKTLWSGVRLSKGFHDTSWDATDDEGKFAGFGDYNIRILSNNIKYTWDGVIGNTSKNSSGPSVHHAYSQINGLTITGNNAYYIFGYAEGYASQAKFTLNAPQIKIHLNTPANGAGSTTMLTCTDGNRVYFAGYDIYSLNAAEWFVFAINVIDNNLSSFSSGVNYSLKYSTVYPSVIDRFTDSALGISGMAVQKIGNYLFISHGSLNQIKVYNKTTGALIQTIPFNSPKKLITDANDNLWIHSGTNTIQKYLVDQHGSITASGLFISGIEIPLALGLSPNGAILAILDGGTSQQIKFYSSSSGILDHIYGKAGGYSISPYVGYDKFFFSYPPDDNTRFGQVSFMSYAPDGSYWVGDTYNRRLLHYTPNDKYIEQIMTLPYNRSCIIDNNNNSRLFSDFLEFKEDATLPVQNSWTLVNNWRYNLEGDYSKIVEMIKSVTTMSNNRTYGLIYNIAWDRWDIVEFTSTGVRQTGTSLQKKSLIMANGNIRRLTDRSLGNPTFAYEQSLAGFDNLNNPMYSPETAIIMTPNITMNDPVTVGAVSWEGFNLNYTSDSNFITYEGGTSSSGNRSNEWHLGAIKHNSWLWKTARGTYPAYSGPYPSDGGYDIGNTVQYAGGPILVKEHSIFWGYHGESWKQSEVNKWQHVYEDGLLLGIFGVTGVDTGVAGVDAAPQMAGNAISASLVKVGSDYYLYHCDESAHGGVHRWHVSGLNTIHEQSIPVSLVSQK
jgi:hypothetical protein